MSIPLLSVLLPFRNGMPYLPETVASILSQTFRDFELVLVDDGSDDDGPAYAKALTDPRVVYHRLEKTGLIGVLNYCLRVARADLVARIDADDVAMPSRLEVQYRNMATDPDCVLLGCDFVEIEADGRPAAVEEFRLPVATTEDLTLRWEMLFRTPFLHPGVMYRRRLALEAGGYRTEAPDADDYDLWARLARYGKLSNSPQILMKKRQHSGNYTAAIRNAERSVVQSGRIAADYAKWSVPGLDMEAFAALFIFFKGRIPELFRLRDAARAFRMLREEFASRPGGDSEEFQAALAHDARSARWRCFGNLRSRPFEALLWARAARWFDPEGTSPHALIRRRVARFEGRGTNDTPSRVSGNGQ